MNDVAVSFVSNVCACHTGERVKVSELLHKQIHDKDLVVDREGRLKAELEVSAIILLNLYSH